MSITPMIPALLVPAPARVPLQYGLFSVVDFRASGDRRWSNGGVTWEVETCDPLDGLGPDFCTVPRPTKNLDTNAGPIGEATPFTVYGHYACSPISNWSTAQSKATTHLLNREEQRVEQALWSGDLGSVPNLHDPAHLAVIRNGAPQSVSDGLAYLEYEIATAYGSQGVIHMTRGMAMHAIAEDLVETKNGRLQTNLGTPVVAGSGYSGEGPEGQPPTGGGQSWAYATPPLFGYRTDVFNTPEPVLDIATNDMVALAERTYLLGYDPCGVAAVLLDQTLSNGGSA